MQALVFLWVVALGFLALGIGVFVVAALGRHLLEVHHARGGGFGGLNHPLAEVANSVV